MADRHVLTAFAALAARAGSDAGFRARLVADPHAAARGAGIDLAPDVRVRFVEKPEGLDHLIVLPDLSVAPAELSDAELEAVSGGLDGTCGVTCIGGASNTNCTQQTTQCSYNTSTITKYDGEV